MTAKRIRWGILGAGRIARKFVASAKATEWTDIAAIASRSGDKPTDYAAELDIPAAHDSYESLLDDPSIDAVYVANTHNFHLDTVLLALNADKAVLCEKPLAVNAQQAKAMIDLARRRKRFLMEGMWTRFLPAVVQLRDWIAQGRIGRPKQVRVSFAYDRGQLDPENRLMNPALAGGALLDHGIYGLSFASMVAHGSAPEEIVSAKRISNTGVDVDHCISLAYPNELTAHCWGSFTTNLTNTAEVIGEHGSITLEELFIQAKSVQLKTKRETLTRRFPYPSEEGFRYEIDAACHSIADGATECPIMPLDETLLLAETMDAIRRQWGLVYPFEQD